MNIVFLTGSNPFDNSGILAFDAYKSLKDHGHSVILLTPNYDFRLEDGMYSVYGKVETFFRKHANRIRSKLFMNSRKLDSNYYMFGLNEIDNYIPTKKILKLIPFQPDLIIYIFPHRFLNARNLYELNQQTKAPVCVMPVDMAQFTGGCHYANECEGFKKQCGQCPGLYSHENNDLTYLNLMFKRKYVSQTHLFTLSNTWTSNLMKESTVFADKPNYSSNVVINEAIYCPGNKDEAKKLFDIPLHKNIIFFGATSVVETRKGFTYLVDALNLLFKELDSIQRDKIGIAIAGEMSSEIKDVLPFETYSLGHLKHEQLPKAFQMADVFVSPSIQDAGPMMVVQSMMCGTPVVAFEMGNAVDYIFDALTGYRAPLRNIHKLKEGIRTILLKTDNEKNEMSLQCRQLALSKSSYVAFERLLISNYYDFKSKNS